MNTAIKNNPYALTKDDLHLFNEGKHFRLYEKLGAHPLNAGKEEGTYFSVWAPEAERVYVMGDFNGWNKTSHPLHAQERSGIWANYYPDIREGAKYKFHVVSKLNGYKVDKADPFGVFHEIPPKTASVVHGLNYQWGDSDWMARRFHANKAQAPWSVYEMHIGSWRRSPDHPHEFLSYRDLAKILPKYLREMGFTHVEFLPVMEHPFYGSWGYQTTGYFAPSSRYGAPEDFMFLIDTLHQHGIGVVLDWVPSHFPSDEHGLAYFDGSHLYEHADPKQGYHPDWKSYIFNYGRHEVRSFLISSALFWLDKYHVDGLRVDAVASMLYLDYSRKDGEWVRNLFGGNENLEAIQFLRQLNTEVYKSFPDVQTIAEESTSWPMVSKPTYVGGLGFGMKWDMGWMNDTLLYMSKEPIHRQYHHNNLTFRSVYAFHENFMLPLSHDEVVYGKGSLINKMSGDEWQKFANLKLLFGYMLAQSGKKIIFMGGEFGQRAEWDHDKSLDWHLLNQPGHRGIQNWVRDLNHLYRSEPTVHESDFNPLGFEWVDANDSADNVLTFIRKSPSSQDLMLVALNFSPVPRFGYRLGVQRAGEWKEVLNSDADCYGGTGAGNMGSVTANGTPWHGRPFSMELTLPPLSVLFFKSESPRL